MINIIDGKFKYNDNIIFDHFNLKINKGEITTIIGNNGIGKTTLSNILSGLYLLNKGELIIDDLQINKKTKSLDIRNKISIVGQNPDSFIIFNKVFNDISFTLKQMKIDGEYRTIITNALKSVGMEKYIDSNPYEMSYGQKQRIAIANSLAVNSDYLVLDEVTAMLDSNTKQDIYKLMNELKKQGKTIIFTTNLMEELVYADNIIVLTDKEPLIIKQQDLIKNIDKLKQLGFYIPLSLEILKLLDNKSINIKHTNKDIINRLKDLI